MLTKRIYAFIILGFAIFIILLWLINYFSTGKIVVVTDNEKNTISLQKTSGSKPFVKIGMGSLSATVSHGQYIATVKNGFKTTVQVIDFKKGHKSFRYSVSLASLKKIKPLASKNAQDIAASNSKLVYLDGSSHTLYKINSKNNITQINSAYEFQTIKWVDPSFGVGQSSSGSLYTIINNYINPLDVPFSYNGKLVNFDIGPNKQVYISYGSSVYTANLEGKFRKIYSATSSNPAIAATADYVAVADTQYGKTASNVKDPLLTVVSSSGKTIGKDAVEAERQVWSPNGQYLASVNETNPIIYSSSLHKVGVVPASSVVGQMAWVNNSSLLYATNDEVWVYNLPAQKAELIAKASPANPVTDFAVNKEGSSVYLTTYDSVSDKFTLGQILLKP